ncbi:MAG: hypothetical protein IMW98_06405 [Firmicutes bacterium]|nr:hypothetical protein [Bacillota bacterium]
MSMQLYSGIVARWPREDLKAAAEWAVRLAAIIGPEEPTARAAMLRLADALIDALEARTRAEFGLPPRDFFADEGGGTE